MKIWYLYLFISLCFNINAQSVVEVSVSNKAPLVGDAFSITCTFPNFKVVPKPISGGNYYPAQFLSSDTSLNNKPCDFIEILSFRDSIISEQGISIPQRIFEVIAWDSCELRLIGFNYDYRGEKILSQQVYINVSYYEEHEGGELFDIKETFYDWSKDREANETNYLFYFLIVLFLGLLIIFGVRKFLYAQKPLLISMTFDEQAKSDIEQLFDKKLWKNDQIQEHFVRFSFILRQYLTLRYELSFLEKTTSQAKILLNQLPIESITKNEIVSLLLASDYIKFADSKIEEASILKMKARVLTIIETTTPIKEEVDD